MIHELADRIEDRNPEIGIANQECLQRRAVSASGAESGSAAVVPSIR
jgi:hypothetical protein